MCDKEVHIYNIICFVAKFEILAWDLRGARMFNRSQGSVAICFSVAVIQNVLVIDTCATRDKFHVIGTLRALDR